MAIDPWHYPREDFTKRMLAVYGTGAKALTMFGPRRTGKTQFLTNDLGPAADRRDYRVVYTSFWKSRGQALPLLLYECQRAIDRKSFIARLPSIAKFDASIALTSSVPGIELSGSASLAAERAADPGASLLELDDRLERLAGKSGKVLLLLDEIQELARDPAGVALSAALRTSLDRRQSTIKAIFTGSSRDGLAAIFTDREAPFFNFATAVELPPLEDDFVDHLAIQFNRATGRTIAQAPAIAAFHRLNRNPEHFRQLFERMALMPAITLDQALTDKLELLESSAPAEVWRLLAPAERVLLTLIARDQKPFAKASLALIGAARGDPSAGPSNVQNTLNRFERDQLIERWSGRWKIADPHVRDWLLSHPEPLALTPPAPHPPSRATPAPPAPSRQRRARG